jgi:putative ABC transport system substrate-binding protein
VRRRDLLAAIGAATIAGPIAARAQQRTQQRIAFVHSGFTADQLTETKGPVWVKRFLQELRRLGHVEGSNLTIERYSAEGDHERFVGLAAEVVARKPDVIVANLNFLVAEFQNATRTTPIIGIVADPVRRGMIASLARPGGNLTGVSIDAGIEIFGKRLEILREMLPAAQHIAYLAAQAEWDGPGGQELRARARDLSFTVTWLSPGRANAEEIRRVFSELGSHRSDALIVSASGDFLAHRQLIVELAAAARIATLYPYRDFVEAGGLIAYAPDTLEIAERLAQQVHEVLGGTQPGEIPFYQASRFELVINARTVKALGLAIAPLLFARADEVIE